MQKWQFGGKIEQKLRCGLLAESSGSRFFYITPVRYFLLIPSLFLLLSCSSNAPRPMAIYDNQELADAEVIGYSLAHSRAKMLNAPRDKGMAIMAAEAEAGGFANYGGGDGMVDVAGLAAANYQKRMVNYTGNISMQSAEPEALIDSVAERAKAKGGSVSNRRNGYISLQIPVAEFKNFFNQILTLGRVTSKNISASDITEAFSDNAVRLRIAEATLARLQQLLAAAKTEQEKIALLKEIQRVSEQIEQRKLEEKELLRQAAFSTINLWASNIPVAIPYRANIIAFEWFSKLPDMNIYAPAEKALKLSVPKDFIETEDSKHAWNAASALNAKFQAFERKNEPQGSIGFWAEAMLEFFKTRYAAELKSEDNFSLVRLQNYKTEPEVHYIALLKKSDEKTLRIAVAYFPNIEAEKKNSEAVLEVLRRVK
jgi:TfoX/Sxy family transcriptional regulator of competence genes